MSTFEEIRFYSRRFRKKFIISETDNIRLEKVFTLIGHEKRVLDLGCGDGFFLSLLREKGHTAEGVEIAQSAMKQAQKKGFTVYPLSLNDQWSRSLRKKYDVVFAGEIIEHILDVDSFCENVRRVLTKNGCLIITTPNLASLGRRFLLLLGKNPYMEVTFSETDKGRKDAGHIRYFTKEILFTLLKKHMFDIIRYESGVVNFNTSGTMYSTFFASLFPTIGNTIIVKAQKK